MNKLFDLRFVIGSFFSLTGLILFIYSFTERGRYAVNHYGGLAFLLFGVLMILLTFRDKGDKG
jgi:uncharacterized membrane protein HdeD (DUF308 family)